MNKQITVLDHGFVELIDKMGQNTTPAEDARISTGSEAKKPEDDKNLIRFLLRHKHTTPFEGVILKFKVRAPIMVIREWFRHRTFSYNEESGRYKKLDPLYYLPEISRIKKQSTTNKQGSGETFTESEAKMFIDSWRVEQEEFENCYEDYIDNEGMSNELARLGMPVSHYSTFIVTGNLLNWFRFLQLRMAQTAQYEIRMYANEISKIIKELFPICYQAFEDYWLNSVTFSSKEMEMIKVIIENYYGDLKYDIENKSNLKGRELNEFNSKIL